MSTSSQQPSAPRSAVIFGSAGGIGLATAERLADDGFALVLADQPGSTVHEAADRLRARSARADALEVDLRDPRSVEEAAATVSSSRGRVDALAVVAGVLGQAARVEEMSVEDWDSVHSVNLRGPFLIARSFVPLLNDGGSIVTIASWWGRSGHAFFSPYCSSKAGLIVFTQCLADELAPRRIRANAICPGNVDTGMHRKALEDEAAERGLTFEEMKAIEWAKIPLGYAGPPSVIADGVAFLVSEHASYITGASLDINGGTLFH
jgi:NAD(P)-dependent dehydrogenase (short-subunit alcohol dehydrogenase family)